MKTVAAIIEQVNAPPEPIEKESTQQKPPPVVIPHLNQESMITGYLQRWQSMFERSTTGIVLEMARLNAYVSCQCKRCEGTGVVGRPKDVLRITSIARSGKYEKGPLKDAIDKLFQDCPECNGTGARSWLQKDWHLEFDDCAPFAPTNGLDVGVSKSKQFTIKGPPDDTTLAAYAIVSRRLARLPRGHQESLRCAFGPEGESWVNTSRGRVWAVTELTPAGIELVAIDPMQDQNKSRMERITDIADVEEASQFKNSKRMGLISKAVMQAGKRLVAAIQSWNLVSGGDR